MCITGEPHSLVERYPKPGHVTCACEDDSCKDAVYVSFRYKAFNCTHVGSGAGSTAGVGSGAGSTTGAGAETGVGSG